MKIIKTEEFVKTAAALQLANIQKDVENAVRAIVPGKWQNVHSQVVPNEPGKREPGTQGGGGVDLYGTDVVQQGDRYYAVIMYRVRDNPIAPKLRDPLNKTDTPDLTLDQWSGKQPISPEERKSLRDAEKRQKKEGLEFMQQLDQTWKRGQEPLNSYDPNSGHVLLEFAVFMSGWKPGMEMPKYKDDMRYKFRERMGAINPRIREGLQNFAQKVCKTPKEAADAIYDMILKWNRPDQGPPDEPVEPSPVPSNMVNV